MTKSSNKNVKKDANLLVSSSFINSIGNGSFFLAFATIVYVQYSNTSLLGLFISSEYVISLFAQYFAGPALDRGTPKLSLVLIDVTLGIVMLAGGALFIKTNSAIWLLPCLLTTYVLGSFYKTAFYSLLPALVDKNELAKLMGSATAVLQAGVLIGVALAGFGLSITNAGFLIIINGISYIISALLIIAIKESGKNQEVKSKISLIKSWLEGISHIKQEKYLFLAIVLTIGDFLSIGFINLLLIPFNNYLQGNKLTLALLDGSFAIGSMVSAGFFVNRFIKPNSYWHAVSLALILQATGFFLLSIISAWPVIVIVMLLIGFFNAVSLITVMTRLQQISNVEFRARVQAVRLGLLSITSLVFLPFTGFIVNNFSINYGFFVAGAILLIFFATAFTKGKAYLNV